MYVADIFVSPKNYSLVILEFLFTTLAIVFVILRVFTRLWIVKNIGFDDAFIVLSTVRMLLAGFPMRFLLTSPSVRNAGIPNRSDGA